MGVYKGDPDWTGPSSITIFGDDYRLGNAQATYADVAPGVTAVYTPPKPPTPPTTTGFNETFTTSPASNFTVLGGTWEVSNGTYNITTASTAVTTHLNTSSIHNTIVGSKFDLTTTATVNPTSSVKSRIN